MGIAFLHGNGGGGANPLNFEVVGNPQPANPKENTIWVNTDVEIAGYVFSATKPETPSEGTVWFETDETSEIKFNALKKDNIMVYPESAHQYVGGAWADKDCESYINGVWVEWNPSLVLAPNTDIAWAKSGASVSKSASNTTFSASVSNKGTKYAQYTVNVTKFSKFTAKGTASGSSSGSGRVTVIFGLYKNGSLVSGYNGSLKNESGTVSLNVDLSSMSGEYQVRFTATSQTESTTAYTGKVVLTSCIFE